VSEHDRGDVGRFPVVTDPLTQLPSSPPQIYLNLLILEASLRSQYLTLRARRRQHTFFLLLLTLWIAYFLYALFLRPREDGRGVGGSVYWVVETAEKLALLGGVVTAMLVWGTGQYERGIRWPKRWLGIANRGLRGINAKLVIIRGPWWREALSRLAFLLPVPSLFSFSGSSSHHYYVGHAASAAAAAAAAAAAGADGKRPAPPGHRTSAADSGQEEAMLLAEEDLSPGGDVLKLLLLPKPFSPGFRENWELYRSEYWEKENERRAGLRRQVQQRRRQTAKQQGGWLWWTGWRGWKNFRRLGVRAGEDSALHPGLHPPHYHHHRHLSHQQSERDLKRRSKGSSRSGSYSGNSSRSTTPTRDYDDRSSRELQRRRSSNASSTGGRPRKLRQGSSASSSRPSSRLIADLRASSSS
jgi:hypothetical protein